MKTESRTLMLMHTMLGTLLLGLRRAAAQTPSLPVGPNPPTPGGGTTASGGTSVAMLVGVAAIILALIVLARLIDVRRQRAAAAVALDSQLAEAFLRDRNFVERPVIATTRVPFWGGAPTIVLTGQVDGPQLRQLARRMAEQEAARVQPGCRIEDRLTDTGVARAA